MYQSPPFPYPPGYGFHPPPGYRTSQTPHPFGTSSKHQRRSSQQVPSSFYSARGGPPHGYTDPRYAAYYSSPLRNGAEHGREYSRKEEPKPPKANQSRPRRASHAAESRPEARPQTTPPKSSSKKKEKPERPQATEADRLRCKIPAGYSLKNWDPSEEPLTLLGSVFDANSLGKWVYDWTCYAYGNGAPMTDTAGDMWLLLIQLAGKNKRADERIDEIRQEEKRELVEDFLESGERLWIRFNKLLKNCEAYMYREAQAKTGEKAPKRLGSDSGVAFVEAMFGRDRDLDATEKLMANIRLWSMRFDANVDAILRDPKS